MSEARYCMAGGFKIILLPTGKFKVAAKFSGPFESYNPQICKHLVECAKILEKQLNEVGGKFPSALILPGHLSLEQFH